MRLKSLKLAGFKSFANPTTFTFKYDITAIVGPNGCGKSNVIDAIRWVLGETSAKQLRGGAMSDVIFAGVEGRAGKSLASVELTFEHTQDERTGIRHALNLYQELTLRRQVTKEGKSDYFINGQRVRRRDVVDVFLGTGLGARSYAVIEQGMIGRIVESSPLELRAFIEEAAGVSRYQARRAETQKQLEQTTDNLERLFDVQSELQKQQKVLIRQAQAAQKYKTLHDELIQLQKQDLLKQLFETWQLVQNKTSAQQEVLTDFETLEAKIATAQNSLQTLSEKLAQSQWLKDDVKDSYHKACMQEQSANHALEKTNHTLEKITQKLDQQHQHKQKAQQDQQHALDELGRIDGALSELLPALEKTNHQYQSTKKNQQQLEKQWQDARHHLTELNGQKQTLEHTQQTLQNQQSRLSHQQEKWLKKYTVLMAQAQDWMQNYDEQNQTLEQKIAQLKARLAEFDGDDDDKIQAQILSTQIKTLERHIVDLEKQHAALNSEYEVLDKLLNQPKPSAFMLDACDDYQQYPSLKDKIVLTKQGEQYADVLDKFIGFWLDAKIGEWSPDETALVIDQAQPATTALLPVCQPSLPVDGVLLPIQQLIQSPCLRLWQDVYVWDVSIAAVPLGDYLKAGATIITTTGWLIGRFGWLHMSKFGQNSDFLTQKTEHSQRLLVLDEHLSEIEQDLENKQRQLKTLNAQSDKLSIALQEKQAQVATITNELYKSEQAHQKLQNTINQLALQKDNHHKNLAILQEEKQELDQELSQIQNQSQHVQNQLDEHMLVLERAKQNFEALTVSLEEVSRQANECERQYQHGVLEQNTLTQAKTHAQNLQLLAEQAVLQADNDICASLQEEKEQLAKLPEQTAILAQAKAQSATLKIQSEEYEATCKHLSLQHQQTQVHLEQLHQQRLHTQTHLSTLGADIAIADSRLQDLEKQMLTFDLSFNLPSLLADFAHKPPTFHTNPTRHQSIKEQIDKLGAVNMAAAAELEELEERLSSMNQQINDITESMDKLQDAIKDIDNKTKTLFLHMLSAVNDELNALFIKVFGGGKASLSLLDDPSFGKDDKWRAGLVLMAQPKGKKNSRLAVLSGGEKTLTALSLIFAIFKQHPAPFCVLDEVDAPLDDANVTRFTNLIGELSSSVQFIFISHNKLAMQTAHELKGITMPTAGISSLVTVSLEDAQKYLEPTA